MPKFQFDAKNSSGQLVRGTVEASSSSEAKIKLRAQGFEPSKIVSASAAQSKKASNLSFGGGVKAKDLQIFTRQMATLVNAGVHLTQSIELLAKGTKSPALKGALTRIKDEIDKGQTLSAALGKFPKIFDRLYVHMVRAGEEAGVLDIVLERLAVYIEKSVKLKGKIVGALWYPAGIIFVAVLVIAAILVFVIPSFQKLFSSSGQELPALTQMVISLSDFMTANWYLVFGGAIVAGFVIKQYLGTKSGKVFFQTSILKVPVIGTLVKLGAIARFTRTMGTLISSGVQITESLEICSHVVGNVVIEEVIEQAKESITLGRTMSTPFAKSKVIPDMVSQMIAVGEQSGAMDKMLNKVADFYEEEVDTAVGAVTSIIEPVLMVVLGGIIAVLVIAMYLPIFTIAGTAGV